MDDSVAQLVEHIPFKDGVLGSRPSWVTEGRGEAYVSPFLAFKHLFNHVHGIYSLQFRDRPVLCWVHQ
jgi:hypothetical protein